MATAIVVATVEASRESWDPACSTALLAWDPCNKASKGCASADSSCVVVIQLVTGEEFVMCAHTQMYKIYLVLT